MSDRQQTITQILSEHFHPITLMVENESHRHHVPANSETHFKVTLVSHAFDDMPLIKRHKAVNQLLLAEFNKGLHALSIHAYTEKEWQQKHERSPDSPSCRDGYKQ